MTTPVLVWEWPHRVWHWLFATSLCVSLYTGFDGSIGAMELHIGSGVTIIGLLLFRLGWALWGGRYVRLDQYRTTPPAIWQHLRSRMTRGAAHTPPGAAMAIAMFVAVLTQAVSGLFSSDDIFTDGPYAHLVNSAGVSLATSIHTRACWVVLGLAALHLTAVAWYGWRRDPVAMSMLNGRNAASQPAITQQLWVRATFTAFAAAAIVWLGSRWA